jgi:hypothetical protein
LRDHNSGKARRDPLPESFSTLDDAGEFWDTHSSADDEDEMENVDVVVEISTSKIYYPIERETVRRLREQARREGVSAEELLHRLLREKLTAA